MDLGPYLDLLFGHVRISEQNPPKTNDNSMDEVELREIQPNDIRSKLPFDNKKCPLIISEQGNATALFRYTDSGPFIELSDPFITNLLPALKSSIIQGKFCIFNFGNIEKLDLISPMLDRLKEHCSLLHKDLYNHIINNSLMKQSFNSLMSLIPFNPENELVPELYENSKETFRILFFAQFNNVSSINDSILSLFDCICIKP